jgi:pimeloyl-ACP methyl ester carboxylesterase
MQLYMPMTFSLPLSRRRGCEENLRAKRPIRSPGGSKHLLRHVLLSSLVLTAMVHNVEATDFRSGYEQIGALNMYYEIHGQGAPLLLLHGGGITIETTFGTVLPEFAKDRTVIAPEQQGHGHTADLDRPLSYRQMADDTAALIQKLGYDQIDVLGFSNGGGVAMELAMRYPERVRRLVIASVYYRRDEIRPELLRSFEVADAESMPKPYQDAYISVAPNPGDLSKLTPKLMENMLGFEGWTEEDLSKILVPTMILQGNYDIAPLEHIDALSKAIPNSQVVVLPGGHGGYLGELLSKIPNSRLPEYTVGIVEEFLNGP